MEENRDFLPAKLNNLKQQLPTISDELAKHLTMLPEELRYIPMVYDYEDYVKYGEKLIEHQLKHINQTELELGAVLIVIKSIDGDEKFYETVCRWGLTLHTAQIYMKNTRDFGDNPEMVEGMGYRKIERLGSLPEEYRSQLKIEGRVLLPDGTEKTMTEFKAMTYKDLNNEVINMKNQYNKKIKNSDDRAYTAERELKAIKKQAEEIRYELEQMREKADPTMAKKIKALEKSLAEKDATINALEIEKKEKEVYEFAEQEAIDAITAAKEAITDVFFKINNIKPGYNANLRAEALSFFEWAREKLSSRLINLDRFLDEPEDDETDN